MSTHTSRRGFLSLCGSAALATISIEVCAQPTAAKIDMTEPTAKALGYVDNVANLKTDQEASFKAGSHCGNCQLYSAAQEKSGYAPCGAFGGKLAAKTGWCRAYSG